MSRICRANLLLACVLRFSSFGQSQDYLTKEQAVDLLTPILGELRPIEGIWQGSCNATIYKETGDVDRTEQGPSVEWTIIRQERGIVRRGSNWWANRYYSFFLRHWR